jgi:hypothetical protein
VLFDAKYKVDENFYQSGFTVKGIAQENSRYENEDGSGLHSSVYHILVPTLTMEENKERMACTSALFTRTLMQVMRATKMVSW